MIINEIFYSLQGEGLLAGIPSVFVRLAGCPLRCHWCDTKYAWDDKAGDDYSIEKILQTVQQWSCKFIVITGGEPMANSNLPELLQRLKTSNRHITVETAGIKFIPDLACDLMSISPKLSNSMPNESKSTKIHDSLKIDTDILQKLINNYKYQLKFVVNSQNDLVEIQQTIEKLKNVDTNKVMLMPQAATRNEFLTRSPIVAEMCKRTCFVFCQRLQILLWNNTKGK